MNNTPPSTRVGTQFGPYLLKRLIGRGGMGEVYEAEDTVKDRVVALKLLPEGLSHDPVFRERLRREARAAGRLQEPHVVPVHDYGEIDGHLYVEMRLIGGVDLGSLISRDGPLSPVRTVAIVRQIASALDAAHAAGVLHRDVKPANILVTPEDFAYLVDFGIASAATDTALTDKGMGIGTFAYMAPERLSNDEVNHRADVYSLACVLYQCLTGTQPFPAKTVSSLVTAHLIDPPPKPTAERPDLSPAFDDVVATGMAKKAQDRYISAGALATAARDALEPADRSRAAAIVDHATVSAAEYRGGTAHAVPRGRSIRPVWVVTGAIVAVLLIAVAALGVWLTGKPSRDSTGPETITRTVTTAPHTTVMSDPTLTPAERRLLTLLPAGYERCEPAKPPLYGAIAMVTCGPNAAPGGPRTARYSLFAHRDTLDAAFERTIAEDEVVPCPGGPETAGHWDYDSTPGIAEGSLACLVHDDEQGLVWTVDSDLFLATVHGSDASRLHDWWIKYS